ncbi:hypothetical protein HID58_054509 [Brassica napus]|uniref:Uncharacterized protein n=1 Tax=Brassica napus TaxID=3708 RepID=A0ABQ8AHS2_BRANA|nr:hypothetical protein HID58_054509 [Brassica napus]
MLSQKWDPGIGYELHNGAEDQQRKDLGGSELRSSDLRRFERVFERWNWGFLRMLRVFNWSMISIVIKTELWRFTGIISAYKNIMFPYPMKGNIRSDQGFALIEIWRYWICYHHEWLWKMADWIFNDEIGFEIYEEGEIKNPKESEKTLPSQDFQEDLAKTQAVGSEVISDPMDAEEGLQMIKSLIVEPSTLEDDKVLDMDECRAICLEHGIDMDAAADLPDCSDGEFEEMLKEQDDEEAIPADLENENMEVEKAHVKGDVAKKQGTRKRLFKPSTAGSTKMRIASALVSPRKRAPAKVGTRHEDHSKHQEIKGTSNPKTGMKNP